MVILESSFAVWEYGKGYADMLRYTGGITGAVNKIGQATNSCMANRLMGTLGENNLTLGEKVEAKI